jgi:hypothetical protein
VRKTHLLASKGSQGTLGATDSDVRPGGFPLGSAQSRAAARALLEARKAKDEALQFQVVSLVDGKTVNLDGLAHRIRAARQWPDSESDLIESHAIGGGQDGSEGRRMDCLAERMRRARERVGEI